MMFLATTTFIHARYLTDRSLNRSVRDESRKKGRYSRRTHDWTMTGSGLVVQALSPAETMQSIWLSRRPPHAPRLQATCAGLSPSFVSRCDVLQNLTTALVVRGVHRHATNMLYHLWWTRTAVALNAHLLTLELCSALRRLLKPYWKHALY